MKKFSFILSLALLLALVTVGTVFAHYSSVKGEIRDGKTQAAWAHGAEVLVFNCNSGDELASTTLSAGTSTFDLSVSLPAGYVPICVQVTFTCEESSGCSGSPGSAAKGPFPSFESSSSGTLDTGSYFSNSGPTAVELSAFGASSSNYNWMPVFFLVFSLVSVGTFSFIKRKKL